MAKKSISIAIPRAHTDGDTIVQFVNADVIMTGDFYRSVQFPNIDRANGGSLRGLEDGLSRVIALCGPNTRMVPGHGAMVDRNAVMAHRDIVIAVHKKMADLVKQGKTPGRSDRREARRRIQLPRSKKSA